MHRIRPCRIVNTQKNGLAAIRSVVRKIVVYPHGMKGTGVEIVLKNSTPVPFVIWISCSRRLEVRINRV